ncbi:hypothetical protein C8Q77DRAFT_15 [Trametes polyzona]|nr:hypothetical protein C8Q77DRAFT_15 [Trametes polyzona]
MDATELGRWTRFAAKGGIGKCTAIQDCVAEQAEDLMFLKDDEITVLMQIPGQPDLYLGYCEGVVGHFRADAVRFHGRLKKPVLTKRQSAVTSPISRPSSSQSAFTVAARDAPSPAITTSFSTGSISAASPAPSPHPERSLSHASSLATTVSNTASAPITPADEGCNSPTIAPPTPDSDPAPSPIRLGEIAKQLATDSPVHPRFSSFDPGTSRFPNDRDSSIYDDSEPSTRISVALSDGGAGIGLSLLQNFAGGGDDSDSDSDAEDANDTSASSVQRTESPESTVEGPPDTARSESQYSQSPRSAVPAPLSTRSESPTSPSVAQPPPSARSESQYSDSPHSSAAPLPSAHSESDYGGEDWEGADDIYDDYRYSRYSVASKMSRFSKGSMHTLASNPEIVPPVPTEPPPRQSSESAQRGEHGRMGSGGLHKPSKLSESTSAPDEAALLTTEDAGEEPMSRLQKNRPAPLTFRKEPEPSPLLHATFGSPQASPTAPTATTASFASPTLVSPVYPTNTGAATNIRKRLERERDEQDDDLPADREDASEGRSGQDLHVRDREDNMPMTAVSQAAEIVEERLAERRQTPPPTPAIPPAVQTHSESFAQSEKRMMMIANADPVSDQPPPPPYSVTAPPVASSSSAPPSAPVPAQPTAPQPGPSAIPPTHPQARPIDPNRPPASPQARQSLFLPHPGAPKPTASSAGPMYGRAPAPHPPPIPRGPPIGSIHHVLQIAMAARREGRPAPPTIYGRFEYDLASSVGPVPITFSLEPQNNVPANRAVRPPMPWTGAGPSRTGSPASMMSAGAPGAASGPGMAAPEIGGRRSTDPAGRQNAMSPPLQGGTPPLGASQPIQRPGFTPVVGMARPRSRSFSGFESGSQEARMQALAQGSREEGAAPPQVTKPLQITTKRSKSAMAATPTLAANVPAPQRATVSHSSSVVRGVHAPSPLSLSVNNVVANASTTAPAPSAAPPPSRTRSADPEASKARDRVSLWPVRFRSTRPRPRSP